MSTGAKNVTFLAYIKHWGRKQNQESEKKVCNENGI
jgi:hypothetical protein